MTASLPMHPGPSASTCCPPAVGSDAALDAEHIAELAKALSEPLRVQIVDVLRRNPKPVCQCELLAVFEIRQSLLSHHMRKLTGAGLVEVERRHKWAYYTVPADAAQELSTWLS